MTRIQSSCDLKHFWNTLKPPNSSYFDLNIPTTKVFQVLFICALLARGFLALVSNPLRARVFELYGQDARISGALLRLAAVILVVTAGSSVSPLHSGGGRSVFGFSMSRKRSKADSGFLHEKEVSAMDELQSATDEVPMPNLGPSYASMLRNGADDAMDDVNLELTEDDCCFTQGEHGVGLCFSEHAHEVLQRSWKSAVVVRLMGKPNSVNSFDFMLRTLRRKWRSRGGWKLIDLLNDWFVVRFELEEDMEDVLCGGPWIIAGQTLVVKRWTASFNPVTDEIGSMAVWARIVGLPVMYFNDFAMHKIGQLLGEVRSEGG